MEKSIKIAHISDFHFSKLDFSLRSICSKRIMGNLNLLLSRRRNYQQAHLHDLIDVLLEDKVNYLIICGDITSTSHFDEYSSAKDLFDKFAKENLKLIYLPGNHDVYTKKVERKKKFYDFFENDHFGRKFDYTLKRDKIEAFEISDTWYAIVLDTAISTSFLSAQGFFSEQIEKNLLKILEKIPSDKKILIANHFPYSQKQHFRKILKRGNVLKEILKIFPNIKLFLNGHTHKNKIVDKRELGLPIIIDSGSIGHIKKGTFNILELKKEKLLVEKMSLDPDEEIWVKDKIIEFDFHDMV